MVNNKKDNIYTIDELKEHLGGSIKNQLDKNCDVEIKLYQEGLYKVNYIVKHNLNKATW